MSGQKGKGRNDCELTNDYSNLDVLYNWTVTSMTILKRQALSSLIVLTVITLILMKLLHRVLIEDNDNVQKVGNVINEDIMFIMSSTLVHNQNDNVAGSVGGVSEVVKDKKEVQYGSIHITEFDL